MAEAALLGALVPAARGLAPQLTALPPLAVFHDLRWLYGYDPSWTGFGLLLAGMLTVRPALNAALIRLAWPAGITPPRPGEALRAAVTFTAATSLLLSPVVSLAFGVAILPFSWPFLATLPVMLLITLPLSHGGILGSWWRTLPPARAAGWLLADFALLSVAAAVIGRMPWLAAVPVAGLAGLGNARGWYGLTSAVARQMPFTESLVPAVPHRDTPIPLAPAAAVLAVAAVVGMTRLAFVVGTPSRVAPPAAAVFSVGHPAGHSAGHSAGHLAGAGHRKAGSGAATHDPGTPARETRSRADPVLEIRGFGATCCRSVWSMRSIAPGALVQQFSYRGISATGRPLPQGAAASGLPLPELGDRIAAQVAQLHRETGRPVDIIAESEGTLGVDAMLAQHPGLPLGAVVMMSPIVAPDPVGQARVRRGRTGTRGGTARGGLVRRWPVPVRLDRGADADQLGRGYGREVRGSRRPPPPSAVDHDRAPGGCGHAAGVPAAAGCRGGPGAARRSARRPCGQAAGTRLPRGPVGVLAHPVPDDCGDRGRGGRGMAATPDHAARGPLRHLITRTPG